MCDDRRDGKQAAQTDHGALGQAEGGRGRLRHPDRNRNLSFPLDRNADRRRGTLELSEDSELPAGEWVKRVLHADDGIMGSVRCSSLSSPP